jgi:tetratricopeptide (TPR) repeat protein
MTSKSEQDLYWQGEHWLKIDRLVAAHGEAHPDVADALNELGVLLCQHNACDKSEIALLRALEIRDKILPSCHPDIAASHYNLAELYEKRGLFDKAGNHYRNSLGIRINIHGSNHHETLISLRSLAWVLMQQGELCQAEEYYKCALNIHQHLVGPVDPTIATSYCLLACVYRRRGQYESSEECYRLALSITERAHGPNHPESIRIINGLALNYQAQGNYTKAEKQYKRVINIREAAFGSHHSDTAMSLDDLGKVYEDQGSHQDAERLFERALQIRKSALGPDHPEVAKSFDNLASNYESQSDFINAKAHYEQALEIREGALDPGHPDVAENLVRLAFINSYLGCHSRADLLASRALEIVRNASRTNDLSEIDILEQIAMIALAQCHFNKAERYLKQALALKEKVIGAEAAETAKTLNSLAILYSRQGRPARAQQFFYRALAIRERVLGPDHFDVLETINGLAELYKIKKLYLKAETLWMRALDINERVQGRTHYMAVIFLSNLASLHFAKGDHALARATLKRAIETTEQDLDLGPLERAGTLIRLGVAYAEQGIDQEAAHLLIRSLAILKQSIGEANPVTQTAYCKLAMIYLRLQNAGLALPHLDSSFRSQLNWLHGQAPLIESDNRRYLLAMRQGLDNFSLKLLSSDSRVQLLFLFVRLNFNGLLQQIEKRQNDLLRLPGEHQPLVEQLRALITVLSSSQIDSEARRALAVRRYDLEVQLYRLLPHFQSRTIEIDDVADALPAKSVLIEFQCTGLPACSSEGDRDSPHYLAFVLMPNVEVKMVDLGPSEELEAAIQEATAATVDCLADASTALLALSERLLQPLLSVVNGCKSWFLSLDGELHRVPFNSLPLPGDPDRLLAETVQLQLVTTGRDLVDQCPRPDGSSGVGPDLVVADPAFDKATGLPVQESHSSRSRDMDVFHVWPSLPGTGMEGKQVSELLGAALLTGANATTLAVQKAHRPRLLHIATHGFFISNQAEQPGDQYSLDITRPDLLANFRGEDPLLRSGLVFAGANHPVEDPELDDGYLTAQEAVHLDLQGTELVTLSACDTGRGDVQTGEGVYGLQRALIVAGARSLLLSLWQVPDEATCEFMVRFYTLLKQGAGRLEALVTVQREFRQHDNIVWRHPFYWGPWQLVGDGGPIEGL